MKSRLQKSLDEAVTASETPLHWARGKTRKAMIQRRQERANDDSKPTPMKAHSA